MEYKYQIGEIVYVAHNTFVVTAQGVYLNGGVPVPNYQLTGVKVEEGTSSLPLTDERIHCDDSMKTWYTDVHLLGVDEYYEDRVKHFEVRKQLLEQDIQVVEEKIKRYKDLLSQGEEEVAPDVSKTPSKYQGYVVRVSDYTSSVLGFVGYNDIDTIEDYKHRSVYGRFVEAKSDMDKFNAANKKSLFSAHVILNGSREYCDYAPECEEPNSHEESKTQEDFSPRKYVVRVTKPHEDGFWYVAKNFPLGSSGSHKLRKVFDTLSEAWQVRSDYNNQAYSCRAVVVPDGTEEYCRNAKPVEVNGEV